MSEKRNHNKNSNSYFSPVKVAVQTLMSGLQLTWKHLKASKNMRTPEGVQDPNYFKQKDGIVTLQYPFEVIPVPINGRYKLHNEIDDCIVCDKCAKVCPVDCIDIVPIRSQEEIGKTSDGTSKRLYAARFDIDMSKCCFCGLCTTVCPTECLTMTNDYDFSEFDVTKHQFSFADMLEKDILEKKHEAEKAQAEKAAKSAAKVEPTASSTTSTKPKPTGMVKPKMVIKPKISSAQPETESLKEEPKAEEKSAERPKPIYRPKVIVPKKKGPEES